MRHIVSLQIQSERPSSQVLTMELEFLMWARRLKSTHQEEKQRLLEEQLKKRKVDAISRVKQLGLHMSMR